MERPQFVDEAIVQEPSGVFTGRYGPFILKSAYQPIFASHGEGFQQFAFEGLIRPSRDSQAIPPLTFFKQVDECDHFFIEFMCRALHLKNAHTLKQPDVRLFINLDPSKYNNPEQSVYEIDLMLEKMAPLSLSKKNIVIEITEAKALSDDTLNIMVEHFHTLNIKIAIDDYGTLYSDARRVESINPDYVKIDGPWFASQFHQANFISQLADVHQYFETKGIQLIYEGIETYEMLATAKACGAKLFQGYLLGKPQLAPTMTWSSDLVIINPPPIV
jgi:EAL domain-containing protein (putative c-di-GMP-specific phosphodiesterase class I)